MSIARIALAFIASSVFGSLAADTMTIDFENLPDAYFFSSGDQNIGTYYAGLDFENNVTALSASRFGGYNDAAYPPHSGDVVIWDPIDLTVTISFATPQSMVGFWYTSFDLLTLTAYDSSNTVLGSPVTAPADTDGTGGLSDFVSVTGANIASVSLQGPPGAYTFDDLTLSPGITATAPEPAPLFLLITAFILCGIAARMGLVASGSDRSMNSSAIVQKSPAIRCKANSK